MSWGAATGPDVMLDREAEFPLRHPTRHQRFGCAQRGWKLGSMTTPHGKIGSDLVHLRRRAQHFRNPVTSWSESCRQDWSRPPWGERSEHANLSRINHRNL